MLTTHRTHTVTKVIEDHCDMYESDSKTFVAARRGITDFILKAAVTQIPISVVLDHDSFRALKSILAIKTSSKDESATRQHAHLVNAAQKFSTRPFVHGNSPTIMLSTLSILASNFLTWLPQSKDENFVTLTRDMVKLFIQSNLSNSLNLYWLPRDFFNAYPQIINNVRRGLIQI